MRWVYILQCEDGYFYVGETSRLFRRFWEHQGGLGGVNTSMFIPEKIVAIYKVDTIGKFIDYNKYVNEIIEGICDDSYTSFQLDDFNDKCEDHDFFQYDKLEAENNIAECLMVHNKETWDKIRGGKYTRFDVDYCFPNNEYIKQLPLCNCGLPCDIKKKEDENYLFFRCAKKNMWDQFKAEFKIHDPPCKYFMKYTKDKQLKLNEIKEKDERKKTFRDLFKKSYWLKNVELDDENRPQQCIGGCGQTRTNKKVTYIDEKRNLCFNCFENKNEELAKKYNDFITPGKCLIEFE